MSGKIRIDKWLWYTRVVKSRSLAQALVKAGKVRVNNVRTTTPSRTIEPDDVLTITLDRQIRILKMTAPGVRRGPAIEAQTLYDDLTPPSTPRDKAKPAALRQAVREEGAGRPTKKERRELDKFRKSGDSFDA